MKMANSPILIMVLTQRGGELCNSFDLLRVHKFGLQDEEVTEDTPINKLPSYKSMQKLAQNDDEVKINMMMETYEARTSSQT